jgi:hypothetical protein
MSSFRCAPRFIAAVIGLTAGLLALPAAWSQVAPGTIGDHDSVFIDGQSFKITPGKAKPDAANRINDLGGREVGAGALIYRRGDKLFLLGAPLVLERPAGPAVETKADTKKEQLGRIEVQYDPPKNPDHQKIYELLKGIKALETVQQMLSPARLPVTLVIKTMECDGMINSWYNTDDSVPTVHMCYELMQNIIKTTPMEGIHADITRRDAIIGQALFWTLHEVGHAAFDIYKVPLFGRRRTPPSILRISDAAFRRDQARRWIEGAYTAEGVR